MTPLRALIGLFWLLSMATGGLLWHSGSASAFDASPAKVTDRGPAVRDVDENWTAPRTDLFGNEIEEALADYRFDGRGVYERHSPETAVPKLGSPAT